MIGDVDYKQLIGRSLAAGILVGIGDVVTLTIENRYIAAMLFSIALLTIIHEQYNLYTGMIGFFRKWKHGMLTTALIFNCLGAWLPVLMMCGSIHNGVAFTDTLSNAASARYDNTIVMIFAGMLCGICMYIAVASKDQLITVFAIMVFILAGFKHCIAEFPYMISAVIYQHNYVALIAWVTCVIGNSLGSILMNFVSTWKSVNKEED